MVRKAEGIVLSGCRKRDKDGGRFASVLKRPTFGKLEWAVVLGVLALCSGLVFVAYLLRARTLRNVNALKEEIRHVSAKEIIDDLKNQRVLNARMKTTNAFSSISTIDPSLLDPEVAAEVHTQCNPSLAPSAFTVDPEAALSASEDQCGQNEAIAIRKALDALAYSHESTIPEPYMDPPMMEQVFRVLNHSQLVTAISHSAGVLKTRLRNHQLALVVQFFAWGWPVNSAELSNVLGAPAIAALQRCQLVMPCAAVPSQWISSLMVYPVPQTSAIIATDWGTRHVTNKNYSAIPVSTVNADSLGLMHNSPTVEDKQVLDLSFAGGVQAVVAALRGAKSAVILETGARAVRMARFNAFLNRVESQVRVGLIGEGMNLPQTFDVFLGQGTHNLHTVLKVGTSLLGENGTFAVTLEFNDDFLDPKKLGKMAIPLPGFNGKIIYQEWDKDNRNLTEAQIKHPSAKALLFGRRDPLPALYAVETEEGATQGHFDVIPFKKSPMHYEYGMSPNRACYWSGLGCPLT